MRSASLSTRSARSVMSSRLPMGVATTYSTPATSATPVARVAEIAVNRALRHFGDYRQAAFVLRVHNAARYLVDEYGREPLGTQFLTRIALIDHEVEEFINLTVGKSQLRLVRLPSPEIGRRLLLHNWSWDTNELRQGPDLSFVEVA